MVSSLLLYFASFRVFLRRAYAYCASLFALPCFAYPRFRFLLRAAGPFQSFACGLYPFRPGLLVDDCAISILLSHLLLLLSSHWSIRPVCIFIVISTSPMR